MQRLLAGLALGLSGPLAFSADLLTVPVGGDLQAVIDAAQPGDVIQFGPLGHSLDAPVVVTRGLTLLGTTLVGSAQLLTVRDLPAGQVVVIERWNRPAGFADFESAGGGPIVRVENCAGAVVLRNCALTGGFGQTGLEVESATVLVSGGVLAGSSAGSESGAAGFAAAPGLAATDARVFAADAVLRGGFGAVAAGASGLPVLEDAAPAVVLLDAALQSSKSQLQGGPGGSGLPGGAAGSPCLPGTAGGAAIVGLGASVAQLDGGGSLQPGANGAEDCGTPLPAPPAIVGFSGPGASIATSGANYGANLIASGSGVGTVPAGGSAVLQLLGLPGELAVFTFAASIAPPPSGSGFGLWLQAPTGPLLLGGSFGPEAPVLNLDLQAPALPPGLDVQQFWLQGATIDPATLSVRLLPPQLATITG